MDFRTEQLAVRPIRLEDAPLYAALWSDPRVHPEVVQGGAFSPENAWAWVVHKVGALPGRDALTVTVCAPEPIGYVALDTVDYRTRLSFAVAPAHQGRGHMTEAVAGVVHRAHASQVEAKVRPSNLAAARLLRAVGFVEIQGTEDLLVFRWSRTERRPALRRPREGESDLAWDIYRRTMEAPTVALLGAWRDQGRSSVVEAFALGRARVIDRDGPIGWFAVYEEDDRLVLGHLYVDPRHQGHGVGTRVVRVVLSRAAEEERTVTLAALRTNPRARALYERLGFRLDRSDEHKDHLSWSP